MAGTLDDEKNLNLNGEFLGVTSLAVYSAPWYLQTPLILLVGLFFVLKVAQGSRRIHAALEDVAEHDRDEDYERLMGEANRIFFGFRVGRDVLPGYWIGTLIFALTAAYCVVQLVLHVAAWM